MKTDRRKEKQTSMRQAKTDEQTRCRHLDIQTQKKTKLFLLFSPHGHCPILRGIKPWTFTSLHGLFIDCFTVRVVRQRQSDIKTDINTDTEVGINEQRNTDLNTDIKDRYKDRHKYRHKYRHKDI